MRLTLFFIFTTLLTVLLKPLFQYSIANLKHTVTLNLLSRGEQLFLICSVTICGLLLYAHTQTLLNSGLLLIYITLLLPLVITDIRYFLLPDRLTLPLLWYALLLNSQSMITAPSTAIIGAAIGYSSLSVFSLGFYVIKNKHGLGLGDCKLFAASGALLGWGNLPLVMIIASTLTLVHGLITLKIFHKPKQVLPFGPGLVFATIIVLFLQKS